MHAYLELLRPPNIVTSVADVLAGAAASGAVLVLGGHSEAVGAIGWLLIAGAALYGGSIVLNDVLDAPLDVIERPERPIPGGRASRFVAGILGGTLLTGGVMAAAVHSQTSMILAALIASFALFYNTLAKHNVWLGPISMGLCRGCNMLLGVSLVPVMVSQQWSVALIPLFYVAAITIVSRGEVNGGRADSARWALFLLLLVPVGVIVLSSGSDFSLFAAAAFLVLLVIRVLPAFLDAARETTAAYSRRAVQAGVLSLIVLDAAIAAGYGGVFYGLLALLLLPLSNDLARRFPVT